MSLKEAKNKLKNFSESINKKEEEMTRKTRITRQEVYAEAMTDAMHFLNFPPELLEALHEHMLKFYNHKNDITPNDKPEEYVEWAKEWDKHWNNGSIEEVMICYNDTTSIHEYFRDKEFKKALKWGFS